MKSRPTAAASAATSRAVGLICASRSTSTAARRLAGTERGPVDSPARALSTMYRGNPPVAACSTAAASSSGARPVIASVSARGVGDVERLQRHLREQAGGPHLAIHFARSGLVVVRLVPHRRGHHDRGVGRQAQAEREERERLRVAPVQVVQGQQHRAAGADQGAGDALEEAVALPGVDHRHRPRPRFRPAPRRGHQPLDLCPPYRGQSGEPRADRRGAQPVRHRRQCQPARGPEALGARDDRTAAADRADELRHEPGLADAGRAAYEHETGVAVGRGTPALVQDAELRYPSDELRPGRAGPRCTGLGGAGLGRRSRCDRRAGPRQQAVERRARERVRLDAELALQDGGAVVIGAHGAGAVPEVPLQLHQPPIAALLQGPQL